MPQVSKKIISKEKQEKIYSLLIDTITESKNNSDTRNLLDDLLSPTEQIMIAKRIAIAVLLLRDDFTHKQISNYLKVSVTTVTKVNSSIKLDVGGYKAILNKLIKRKEFVNLLKSIYFEMTTIKGKGRNWENLIKVKHKNRRKHNEPF